MLEVTVDEIQRFPEFLDYIYRTRHIKPARYGNIYKLILLHECRSLMEIGVFNGDNAERMIQTAMVQQGYVQYVGFDLFEDMTPDKHAAEFSKRPSPIAVVYQKLHATGADVRLIRGDTTETLAPYLDIYGCPEFVFIDGGHSHDTITSDWYHVSNHMNADTIVLFDDYYPGEPHAMAGFGCNHIVDNLSRDEYQVQMLEPVDMFEKEWGELFIQMVAVRKRG
jgi:hypothetical protein